MTDFSQTDIYTDVSLVDDPWPYFEYLRSQGPIAPLPHRKVLAVTGFEEALAIYADPASFSSINSVTGPIPDLPFVPRETTLPNRSSNIGRRFRSGVRFPGSTHRFTDRCGRC